MRTTMIRSAALLLMMTTTTLAAGLYRCDAKDTVLLEDDGTLSRGKASEFWREQNRNIIVDTATGAIRFRDDFLETWKIVQEGGPASDFIIAPRLYPADIAARLIASVPGKRQRRCSS